jgi:phosphoribosylformylglycinamidine synthase
MAALPKVDRRLKKPPLPFGAAAAVADLPGVAVAQSELCFNVEHATALTPEDVGVLSYLLSETFEPEAFGPESSFATCAGDGSVVVEVGPRTQFETSWSTNAVSICKSCGLTAVERIEVSRRFCLITDGTEDPAVNVGRFTSMVHDRMTEMEYDGTVGGGIKTFRSTATPEKWTTIPLLTEGEKVLIAFSTENGLGFDEQDVKYYLWLFCEDLKRNPTSVELFDLAQGNSEHSRHWFFGGKMVLDGVTQEDTLFQLVKKPYKTLDSSLYGARFRQKFTLEDAIGFKACSLDALAGV